MRAYLQVREENEVARALYRVARLQRRLSLYASGAAAGRRAGEKRRDQRRRRR